MFFRSTNTGERTKRIVGGGGYVGGVSEALRMIAADIPDRERMYYLINGEGIS
jgi:hypothetical protein